MMDHSPEFNIEEELRKLPAKPGVYLMHGENDEIIYVGKAIRLKNRVRQYFQGTRNKGIKTEQMVSHVNRFEYIVTDSEMEALVLECNLIKEHHPKYNIMLMDDKSYPYIRVTTSEAFPRIQLARKVGSDRKKNRYFGPYTSSTAVRQTLDILHKLYQIRTCSRKLPEDTGKGRPCLNYHIHQCKAPCQGYISPEEYAKQVEAAVSFLEGHDEPVKKDLKEKMLKASEEMEYETAGAYKELLEAVELITQKQKITERDWQDRDVIAVANEKDDAVVQVFFIRGGKMIGRDHFYLRTSPDDSPSDILTEFVKQYYAGTPYIPADIMLSAPIGDEEVIAEWLTARRGQKVRILVPQKGRKEKLVELAAKNARMVLEQDRDQLIKERKRTIGAMEEIESALGLSSVTRVEAYDISNTGGYESVGSMVVFENGRPKHNDYRKFNIRTVAGPDDYASLKEVLSRRFRHGLREQDEGSESSFTRFPDLIMMDGGRGQVNIAEKVLSEIGLSIPVCGLVKDDRHRTRGMYYHNKEIPISSGSEGFRLITRIQDEAHRFAITSHRLKRGKKQVHSILDDIPGVGPARRKALRREFETLDDMRNASAEDFAKIPEIPEKLAHEIYEFFHKETMNEEGRS